MNRPRLARSRFRPTRAILCHHSARRIRVRRPRRVFVFPSSQRECCTWGRLAIVYPRLLFRSVHSCRDSTRPGIFAQASVVVSAAWVVIHNRNECPGCCCHRYTFMPGDHGARISRVRDRIEVRPVGRKRATGPGGATVHSCPASIPIQYPSVLCVFTSRAAEANPHGSNE